MPLLAAFALVTAPVAATACDTPDGWRAMVADGDSGVTAAINLNDVPVQLGEPFSVEVVICSDGNKTIERISVDATMPAHKHGMNYRPKVIQNGDDRYTASGMFFHMRGNWRISVAAHSTDDTALFSLNVPAQ